MSLEYVVGLDQATKCGYAVLDASGARIVSGVWDLSPRTGEGAGFRFVRFVGYLRQLLDKLGINGQNGLIFYEQSFAGPNNASEIAGGLISHIEYQGEIRGIPYSAIHYGTVKKIATGNGHAGKLRMVTAANQQFGLNLPYTVPPAVALSKDGKPKLPSFPGGSDNEADALWIAWAGLQQVNGS